MKNIGKMMYFEYCYYHKNIKKTRRIFILWIIKYNMDNKN